MKKLFLFSALALCAMTMSAKLNLEYIDTIPFELEIDGELNDITGPTPEFLVHSEITGRNITSYFYSIATCKLAQTVTVPLQDTVSIDPWQLVYYSFTNLWTDDGKICFILNQQKATSCLYNEDGELLKQFSGSILLLSGEGCYYVLDVASQKTTVYKIPYNVPTSQSSPTATTRTSNARKVVENGQMYIILDGVKYAVTGSSIL